MLTTPRLRAADALGVARILVFGIWLFKLAPGRLLTLSDLPFELFESPGLFRFLPDRIFQVAVNPAVLTALQGLLVVGCSLLVLGVRPFRPIALLTCTLLLFADGLSKGFNGFINHAQLGILYAALILAFVPAADALSVMGRAKKPVGAGVYRGAFLAVAAVLCAAYSFTGTHRVVNGGFAIFQGDAIIIWMASRSLQYSEGGFDFGLLALSYPWLSVPLKVGYFVTTIFEVLSPIALISAPFRRLWLFVILPFHFFTLLTMNIFFWENMLLVALFVGGIGYVLHPPQVTSEGSPAQPVNRNATGTSVILFDGVCNLCNRWVLFVIDHDPRRRFSFASLQSDFGQTLLRGYHAPVSGVRSLVLLEDGRCYVRSSAVLRIARHLSGPWRLLYAFTWVPRQVRDAVYDWIARNRYDWVGRTDHCLVPSPELAERFLDESPSKDRPATSGHRDSVTVGG